MDFITGTLLRLIILASLVVFEAAVIFGIFRHRTRGKVAAAVVVPVLLIFCMFFQGAYRKAPISTGDLVTLAKQIEQQGVDSYAFGIYDDEKTGLNGIIDYFSDADFAEITAQSSPPAKLFSVSGSQGGYEYFLTPAVSDRPLEGFRMHQGYDGEVFIKLSNSEMVTISYSVYRGVDKWGGFIFAAPLVKQNSRGKAGYFLISE